MKALRFILTIMIVINIITIAVVLFDVTSPVERIIDCKHHHVTHDELVNILDSVLDARFGSDRCYEVIDSDDISIPLDSFMRK